MEKITFDITPEGITIDSSGFKGNTCLKELESLKTYLKQSGGIDLAITDQKKKPAYYQPADQNKNRSRVI